MGFDDELDEVLGPAKYIVEDNFLELVRWDDDQRIAEFETISEGERRFRNDIRRAYPNEVRQVGADRIRITFRVAKLKLAAASYYDHDDDPEAPLADDYSTESLQLVQEVNEFRQFNFGDSESIERQIRDQSGLYEFIEDHIRKQYDDRSQLLSGRDHDIPEDVMRYYKEKYQDRFDRINEAIGLYIKYHGPPNVVDEIEAAVNATHEAAEDRQAVRELFREELQRATSIIDNDLQEQTRWLSAQLSAVDASVDSISDSVDDVSDQIDEVDQSVEETSKDVESVTNDILGLQSRVDELDADTAAQLQAELTPVLEDLQGKVRGIVEERDDRIEKLDAHIAQLETLEDRVDARVTKLQEAHDSAVESASEVASERAAALVDDEVDRLKHQRSELSSELTHLRREREEISDAADRAEAEYDRLSNRVQQLEQSFEDVTDDKGADVVPAGVARLAEMDFISRFDQSIREAVGVVLPNGDTFEADGDYWDSHHRSSDHRTHVDDLIAEATDDASVGAPEEYPLGKWSAYDISESSMLGAFSTTHLVVEAAVTANHQAFVANGFDARPAGIADLLAVANDAVSRAKLQDVDVLLGVASPTGWSDRACELLSDDEFARSRFSRDVSLCLIDLQRGEVVYDESDQLLDANQSLFERELDAEKVTSCLERLEELVSDSSRSYVSLREVADGTGYPEHVVKEAFDRLSHDRGLNQVYSNREGLGLNVE